MLAFLAAAALGLLPPATPSKIVFSSTRGGDPDLYALDRRAGASCD